MNETRSPHARRQVGAGEFVEPLTRATHLHFVAPTLADTGKDEATRVVERAGADTVPVQPPSCQGTRMVTW